MTNPQAKPQTEIDKALEAAIVMLTVMRGQAAARLAADHDDPDYLRAIRGAAFDVAVSVDPIFAAIARSGNVVTPAFSYSSDVFNMIHDDLAAELSVAASEAADRLDEGVEYERDDFAEHNTLFAAAQL